MGRLLEFAPSAAFYLLALAAQLSGYTNPMMALGLAVIATACLAIPAGHHARAWHRARRASGRMTLEPSHLIWFGFVGAAVCLAIAAGGYLWQQRWSSGSTEIKTTLIQPAVSQPAAEDGPIKWNNSFGTRTGIKDGTIYLSALMLSGVNAGAKEIELSDAYFI